MVTLQPQISLELRTTQLSTDRSCGGTGGTEEQSRMSGRSTFSTGPALARAIPKERTQPWQTQRGGGVGMRLPLSLLAVWKEGSGESNQGPPTAYRLHASLLFNGV